MEAGGKEQGGRKSDESKEGVVGVRAFLSFAPQAIAADRSA